MRFLLWLIGFLITVQITAFAVLNRDIVSVTLNPVGPALQLPLYAVALGFVVYGFLIGAFIVWINGAEIRKTRRQQRKTIKTLEKELAQDHKSAVKEEPLTDFFPALLKKH
jgi:uncharacterized integral membrane protein